MDWRDRFRAPVVRSAERASGRPDRGVVISDRDGPFEAYAWDVATGSLRRATDQGIATLVAAISPDGGSILHLTDTTGAEHGHIAAVPFAGGAPVDLTPDLPPYAVMSVVATDAGFVAGVVVDGRPHLLQVDGATAHLVAFDGAPLDVGVTSDVVAVTTFAAAGGVVPELVLCDRDDLTEFDRIPRAERTATIDDRLGLGVVEGDWQRPAIRHPDGRIERLAVDLDGDVTPVAAHGSAVLLRWSHRSVEGLAVLDGDVLRPLATQRGAFGRGTGHDFDGVRATAVWSDATTPATIVEVDADGHRPVLDDAAELPGAQWEEFTVTGVDGAAVQGWLVRPPGHGPHPTVVNGHGGPTSVQGPTFSPVAQTWVEHGYVYASVNYRGSTGFGEEFREALSQSIGGPELDDVVAAREWLVDEGIADPAQVIVNGYSYGGYLTCMLLGTHPDLWAAGIAGAPITDWVELFEDSPATRSYAIALFGGGPDTHRAQMTTASPSAYVDAVRAPLLVSAPVDDARTPYRPVIGFVDRLRERGIDAELQELRGGHAGVGTEQTIAMVERWVAFADRVLATDDHA